MDCSGHGTGVANTGVDQCQCKCDSNWLGNACSECPPQYDAKDCKTCSAIAVPVAGASGQCRLCQQDVVCPAPLGLRTYVTTNPRTNEPVCACDCAANVRSLPDVSGGRLCNVCASGYFYVNGASVSPVPTLQDASACKPCLCGGRGRAIGGDGIFSDNCVCECDGFWGPASGTGVCGTCPACPVSPTTVCTGPCGSATCPCCYDTTCTRCARDRVSPPSCSNHCDDLCGVPDKRATKAQNFANADQSGCMCSCTNGFTGATCSECMEGYKRNDINGTTVCMTCTNAIVAADNQGEVCRFHIGFVVDNADKCHCKCQTGYTGRFCTQCAEGYYNYPACQPFTCTNEANCHGRATSVIKLTTSNTCQCLCSHQWKGDTCNDCPAEYDPANCNTCARGRADYPRCIVCDAVANAASVTVSADARSCVVECNKGYTCRTPPCSRCDICDVSRGYFQLAATPLACELCSASTHCSGHATRVVPAPDATGCVCTCAEGYSGDKCDKCALTTQQYPYCVGCSIPASCRGNAVAVKMVTTSAGTSSCECQCSGHWQGPQCDVCPEGYDPTRACNDCAEGYVKEGNGRCVTCKDRCGKAKFFTSSSGRTECICGCECSDTQCFGGANCDRCELGFVDYPQCVPCSAAFAGCVVAHTTLAYTPTGTADCVCKCAPTFDGPKCDRCAAGYHDYPTCRPCDLADCSGPLNAARAYTILQNQVSVCKCACIGAWDGDKCDTCPSQYDASKSCSACAPGYFGYPDCRRCDEGYCTSVTHGVATVDLVQSKCYCICAEGYGGATCAACAAGFFIEDGYVGHGSLKCARCDISKHCSANTVSVEPSTDQRSCVCKCAAGWAGNRCERCAEGYMADNTASPPTCRRCNQADCSYHASYVTTLPNSCRCICSEPWTGDQCQTCPSTRAGELCRACESGYDNFPMCDRCLMGYYAVGDLCVKCDLSICSGRGLSVVSNSDRTDCECQCLPAYTGRRCDRCADGYKRVGTVCVRCTTSGDCAGHAVAVITDIVSETCICTCSGGWSGSDCTTCSPTHFGPKCEPCTVQHCYGRATAATVVEGACICRDKCHDGYEGDNCERCADGYIGWPYCVQCSIGAHCNGNAVSVRSNFERTKCECSCKKGFRVETLCADCDGGFAPAQGSCEKCPAGTVGNPGSCRACSSEADCGGKALRVVALDGKCYCTCQDGFTGANCKQCDTASWFVEYPSCRKCDKAVDCMGRGEVAGPRADGQGCQCTCRAPWFGNGCAQCSAISCPPCGYGAVGAPPDCRQCDGAIDCSGNHLSVTVLANGLGCACTCQPKFSGTRCNACAAGHFGYPSCGRCTSADYCNGLGTAQLTSADACSCSCRPQYTGVRCELCSDGFFGWPACKASTGGTSPSESPGGLAADATATREMAITTCLGSAAETESSIRTALLNAVGVPGSQLVYTRAVEAATDVGSGCTVRAFRINSLPAGSASQTERSLVDSVSSNQALRLQLRVVGELRVLTPAPDAQSDSGTVEEPTLLAPSGGGGGGGNRGSVSYLFGTNWLTPGLCVGILVGGLVLVVTVGIVAAFVIFFLSRPFAVTPPPLAG